MIRNRTAEQWKASFHSAPWVSYAEALCWIFYRDVDAMVEVLDAPGDLSAMGSGTASAMLALTVGRGDWARANPELLLLDALEAGRVKASAHIKARTPREPGKPPGWHVSARRDVEPDEWQGLKLQDAGAPDDKATAAFPKDHQGGEGPFIYTDILFSRADLTTAFPGDGANQVIQLVSSAPGAARSAPSQTEFMQSGAALAEAVARLTADGEDVGKLAILRRVADAFHAAGYAKPGQTAASVFASMKARSSRIGLDLDKMLRRAAKG